MIQGKFQPLSITSIICEALEWFLKQRLIKDMLLRGKWDKM